MKFRTRYESRVPSKGTKFVEESLALQSEYEATTIDYYRRRYNATGVFGDMSRAANQHFEDVSNLGDYHDLRNRMLAIKSAFDQLPAIERRKYGDDPAEWLEAMQAEQLEEAAQAAQAVEAAKAVETASSESDSQPSGESA